jgi:oligopeptide transport system ATP-binding protein
LAKQQQFIELHELRKSYVAKGGLFSSAGAVKAVDGVSLTISRGEVFALVGESGSGKSTVGKLLLRLEEPTSGGIRFDGTDLLALPRKQLRTFRRRMQMIFQDPFASLNPHMRVNEMLEEALVIHGIGKSRAERRKRVAALLSAVGLSPAFADRYPHEFSGGQRQRLGIARALAVEPEFIVADEAVSALDVSNQAQIVNILMDLKRDFGLTLLFISHNLAVVQNIADTVAVMYLGRLMEIAPAREIFTRAGHPYTAALLSAIPIPEPKLERKRIILHGDIPSPLNPPSGCVFRTRCPYAIDDCAKAVPAMREVSPGHQVACIRHDDIAHALFKVSAYVPETFSKLNLMQPQTVAVSRGV